MGSARCREVEFEGIPVKLDFESVNRCGLRRLVPRLIVFDPGHGDDEFGGERNRLPLGLDIDKLDLDHLGLESNTVVPVKGVAVVVAVRHDGIGDTLREGSAPTSIGGSMATPDALRDPEFAIGVVHIALQRPVHRSAFPALRVGCGPPTPFTRCLCCCKPDA